MPKNFYIHVSALTFFFFSLCGNSWAISTDPIPLRRVKLGEEFQASSTVNPGYKDSWVRIGGEAVIELDPPFCIDIDLLGQNPTSNTWPETRKRPINTTQVLTVSAYETSLNSPCAARSSKRLSRAALIMPRYCEFEPSNKVKFRVRREELVMTIKSCTSTQFSVVIEKDDS